MEKIVEKSANKLNGFLMLFISIALLALAVYLLISGIQNENRGAVDIHSAANHIFLINIRVYGYSAK